MRTTPEIAPPLQTFATHGGGRLSACVCFDVQHAQYTLDLQWNRVSVLGSSVHEDETLPLDHRGLQIFFNKEGNQKTESPALPWHLHLLNDCPCNRSSTAAGILIVITGHGPTPPVVGTYYHRRKYQFPHYYTEEVRPRLLIRQSLIYELVVPAR
ncbi:hypothetical protein AVEN_8348-1 [Araneus ventricosus]|uniref:Uncharacterized protein n=1 Tax=Araneus ventricosus TaxID=182803 RepID=A0A4Y2N2E7_ARAVE|nr:hypothetical protein AVEN_8348-1 [Araneus ventricosus]